MMSKPYNVAGFDDSAILGQQERWSALDSKVKGTIAEDFVRARLAQEGFDVWTPYMNNHRSDVGVLVNGRLLRIQVKSASYDRESKRFRAMLQTRDKKKNHIAYRKDELDFFIVFCPFVNEFYVIPANVGIANHSVNMMPHRGRAISVGTDGWEQYRSAFALLRQSC